MAQPVCSILVVDDDPDVRLSLSEVLACEGFSVESAAHGLDALQILRSSEHSFHLVLLDLMMPVMNGWQFRREQQQDPGLAEIPVLVLSAGSHIADAASSIGAVGYLRKPVDLDDLLAAVERLRRK